ncbi:WhiB family transcriptional regulator [Peterkaempfera bronchialis]|uniref:WhiB family transcriptional regulator n=1 Tax=Peterkaempfera bronchialis TaxID=2126346 RepID=UPI003C2FE9D6
MNPTDEPRGIDLARLALRRAQADTAKARTSRRVGAARCADREPVGLASVLGGLIEQHARNAPLSGGAVTDLWFHAAGELASRTNSPADATHLRLVAAHLVAEINRLHGQPSVRSVRVLADRSSRAAVLAPNIGTTGPDRSAPGPVGTRENASADYQRALAQLQAARARVPADPLAAPAIERKVRALARATHTPATDQPPCRRRPTSENTAPVPDTLPTPIPLVGRRRDHSWVTDAACAGTAHPNRFHPLPDETEETAAAKATCATCPVSQQCLDEALEMNDRWGIRSGLSEAERLVLHRRAAVFRWEEQRVRDALAGRPVHLSRPERTSVVTVAAILDLDVTSWAPVLGISRKYGLELLREARSNLATQPLTVRREQRIAASLATTAQAVAV